MDEDSSDKDTQMKLPGGYPEAAAKLEELARTVFLRLTAHSRFPAMMLAAPTGPAPLPGIAARMGLPLASALPLCECEPSTAQVRNCGGLNLCKKYMNLV